MNFKENIITKKNWGILDNVTWVLMFALCSTVLFLVSLWSVVEMTISINGVALLGCAMIYLIGLHYSIIGVSNIIKNKTTFTKEQVELNKFLMESAISISIVVIVLYFGIYKIHLLFLGVSMPFYQIYLQLEKKVNNCFRVI